MFFELILKIMVTSRWISRVLVISFDDQNNNNQLNKKLSMGAKPKQHSSEESETEKLRRMSAAEIVLKMCQQIFLDFKFKTTNSSTIMASSSENSQQNELRYPRKIQWHRKTLEGKYNCKRCSSLVYPVDSIGPLKSSTYFHSGCFRCVECNSKLSLKTFNFNQECSEDDEVYCINHVPKVSPGKLDGDSLGIQAALNVPKSVTLVNEQIRPPESTKVRADKCLENGESILTCNNLEILCDDGDDSDIKIEKHFDECDTSLSISSGTSSLSSATGSWLTISSSSCSIDEIHFQMNQLENPQKLDVMLPIAAGSDAVIMIEQENEELDLNENLDDTKVVVATPELPQLPINNVLSCATDDDFKIENKFDHTSPSIFSGINSLSSSMLPPENVSSSFEDIYCQTLMKLPIGWVDATEVLEKESANQKDDNDDDGDPDGSSFQQNLDFSMSFLGHVRVKSLNFTIPTPLQIFQNHIVNMNVKNHPITQRVVLHKCQGLKSKKINIIFEDPEFFQKCEKLTAQCKLPACEGEFFVAEKPVKTYFCQMNKESNEWITEYVGMKRPILIPSFIAFKKANKEYKRLEMFHVFTESIRYTKVIIEGSSLIEE